MSLVLGAKAPAPGRNESPPGRQNQALLGIALAMAAVACFATLDTTIQWIGAWVPIAMAMWFRFTFQAVSTTAVVLSQRGLAGLRSQQPGLQLLRGALLVTSSSLAFLSLRYTPVAEFTAIVMLTPLIITLVAAWKLKEKIPALRWALVIGGFVGTLIIVRLHSDDFNWGLLLPLALVGTSTGFQLMTSRLARTDDPAVTHLFTGWIGSLLASTLLPFVWVPIASVQVGLALGLLCLMGTVGHYVLILAYRKATPGILTPYLYGQVVFAMLAGWVVFGYVPDGWSLFGIALITGCGALGTWLTARESRNLPQLDGSD